MLTTSQKTSVDVIKLIKTLEDTSRDWSLGLLQESDIHEKFNLEILTMVCENTVTGNIRPVGCF